MKNSLNGIINRLDIAEEFKKKRHNDRNYAN